MKTCRKMQAVVRELSEKFEVDLGEIASYMRLDMQGFDRLCIENLGNDRVSVASSLRNSCAPLFGSVIVE